MKVQKTQRNHINKLEILLQTQGMTEDELGVFLRSQGLNSTDLDEWKTEISSALEGLDEKRRNQGALEKILKCLKFVKKTKR